MPAYPHRHTHRARAVARFTGWNVDDLADTDGWRGVGVGPVGRHRDSPALEESNFRCISADLTERFPEHVAIARFGHWAVGWVEEITWNTGNPTLVRAVRLWKLALAAYPVADEEHYADVDDEFTHPGDGCCYADEPESCPCELPHIDDRFTPR